MIVYSQTTENHDKIFSILYRLTDNITNTNNVYEVLASIPSYSRPEFVLLIIVSFTINVRSFIVMELYDQTEEK